eukprot:363335-Chlamydomonas_euryale.AAC.11
MPAAVWCATNGEEGWEEGEEGTTVWVVECNEQEQWLWLAPFFIFFQGGLAAENPRVLCSANLAAFVPRRGRRLAWGRQRCHGACVWGPHLTHVPLPAQGATGDRRHAACATHCPATLCRRQAKHPAHAA